MEWSTDLTNITTDIETYAVWKDDHSLAVTSFNDNIVHIECTKCGKQQIDASFTAILNAEKGDENYVALADVNNDGIINGKDYARLLNTFRNLTIYNKIGRLIGFSLPIILCFIRF